MPHVVARCLGALAAASALALVTVSAQQRSTTAAGDLSLRILAADYKAIVAAGESGDRTLIPFLRTMLEDPRLEGSKGQADLTVEIALAKLDDTRALQALWCAAIREDRNPPVSLLGHVGGWFGLRSLEAILSGVGHAAFMRAIERGESTDISYLDPVALATEILPDVAPDGPKFPWYSPGAAERWRQWIAAHRHELSSRKPTGDDVVYTESACKNGKPTRDAARENEKRFGARIIAGSADAIEQAATSGDSLVVPYLMQVLRYPPPNRDANDVSVTRGAIARIIRTDQMQEMWCRAIGDEFEVRLDVEDLGRVGGWFGIQALQKLLRPENQMHWARALGKEKPSKDVIYLPPRLFALKALADVVSNPPVALRDAARADYYAVPEIKAWDGWIAAHKDELSTLEPTGEGVDLSDKACKNGKPVKRR